MANAAIVSCANCANKCAACARNRFGNPIDGRCPIGRALRPLKGTAIMGAALAAIDKADAVELAAIALAAHAKYMGLAPEVGQGDLVEYAGADGSVRRGKLEKQLDDFCVLITPMGEARGEVVRFERIARNLTAEKAAEEGASAPAIDDLAGLVDFTAPEAPAKAPAKAAKAAEKAAR